MYAIYIYCIPNGFATGEELQYASEKVIKIPSACYLPSVYYIYQLLHVFIYKDIDEI